MFDYTRKMAAIEELKTKAAEARAHAHCPYSNFRVGAAVLCEDGSIFVGRSRDEDTHTSGNRPRILVLVVDSNIQANISDILRQFDQITCSL